jgi:hypothetical protein
MLCRYKVKSHIDTSEVIAYYVRCLKILSLEEDWARDWGADINRLVIEEMERGENMKMCKECECDIPKGKRWGYAHLCDLCDSEDRVNKSVGVLIADGKTDYHFQVVQNPSKELAASIRSAGLAHDPRTQLKAINKVSK